MYYVYADNYRGFRDKVVTMRDVNFFVGENSTGKTSFLALLQLLSPGSSWEGKSFDFREFGLTTFKDIVSSHSENRKYFSIGIFYPDEIRSAARGEKKKGANEGGSIAPTAIVAHFSSREGLPRLARYVVSHRGWEMQIAHANSGISFRLRKSGLPAHFGELTKDVMAGWAKKSRVGTKGFKKATLPPEFFEHLPISAVAPLILANINEKPSSDFLVAPYFLAELAWLAPIRTKPRKTYDEFVLDFSPEGEHTPYVIRKILSNKKKAEEFREFIQKFGSDSGLFGDVVVKKLGKGSTDPFEVDVVINSSELSISNVGYGVSQVLPVIVEAFTRGVSSSFAIQQPEVHLHPKAQAALGDVFFHLASNQKKAFFVETHSDYAIDRFRRAMRKSKNKVDAQVLFFERADQGNEISELLINPDGSLDESQPSSYRDFFIREQLDMLGL